MVKRKEIGKLESKNIENDKLETIARIPNPSEKFKLQLK